MTESKNFTITKEVRSKAGKARAAKLTPEERSAIAKKANHSRKCMQGFPKATHSGELIIGGATIECAVLEDGRRVITESSMFRILGRTPMGRKPKKGGQVNLPAFLAANNIKSLVASNLSEWSGTIEFVSPKFGKAYGYEATIIPEICKIYIEAEEQHLLLPNQIPTAKRAKVILHSLAKLGIISLIDESTGFQKDREHQELQNLFSKFIAKELQPWTKRFPSEFFENIKRLYDLEHLKGNPRFAGHLINRYIYGEISPEVLEEIKKKNPISEKGYRRHRHHQFLTSDIGHPALDRQITKVNTLMSCCDTKDEFDELFMKSKR